MKYKPFEFQFSSRVIDIYPPREKEVLVFISKVALTHFKVVIAFSGKALGQK
nr:hypothetical protein [uncultured Desulfobacter sp.]